MTEKVIYDDAYDERLRAIISKQLAVNDEIAKVNDATTIILDHIATRLIELEKKVEAL